MKIGVFDSGIGGLSVAKAIEQGIPDANVLFVHDTPNHFPYATKTADEIYSFIVPVFESLVRADCDVIVVACNTVSTMFITQLREAFDVPMVAIEPMVKPAAALTKTGKVIVCATPHTLASERYAWLKKAYGKACIFVEPDCTHWSYLIEHNRMHEAQLQEEIEPALAQGADVIVLACTHYHWIEDHLKAIAKGRAEVIQPETAIVAQVKRVLGLAA